MKGKTILVVDDSPLQAMMLRRSLVQAEFTVLMAKDGMEGLEVLKKAHADLVISDVNMPRLNGFEFCRAIKQDPAFQTIPVILCTVLSSPTDLIEGIDAGAENYITRPWNDKNLFTVIDGLLKPRTTSTSKQADQTPSQAEEVIFSGKKYHLNASRQHILDFLLSTYQNIHTQNQELIQLREELQKAYSDLELGQKDQQNTLSNVFPDPIAQEIITYGVATPTYYESISLILIELVGVKEEELQTQDLQKKATNLVMGISLYFDYFDKILENNGLQRIKTQGNCYLGIAGIPETGTDHALKSVTTALEIYNQLASTTNECQETYHNSWGVRIGIHTGAIIGGVISKKRPSYDIWGPTVEIGERIRAQSASGKIYISDSTYAEIKTHFKCEKCSTSGELEIYSVEALA